MSKQKCQLVAENIPVRRLVSSKELQMQLGVSRSTIYRWEKAGLIPPSIAKFKRRYWYAHVLEAWGNF